MIISEKNLKNKELLLNTRKTLNSVYESNPGIISLYDISTMVTAKKYEFNKVIEKYMDKFAWNICNDYNMENYAFVNNYSNNKLTVGFFFDKKYSAIK